MSAGPFSGSASIRWGDEAPCACHAQANPPRRARRNPPASAPDLAGITAVYDLLGTAVAVGALADRLGVPGGADLVAQAGEFARTSPTLNALEAAETGSALGVAEVIGERLTGSSAGVWSKVEARAAAIFERAKTAPGLIFGVGVVGVGALLGSQYLTAKEKNDAVALANQTALTKETLARMTPEDAARALKELSLIAPGGSSSMSWVAWGAIGLGLLVAWNVVRSLLPRGS